MKVHTTLGKGFREAVYGDALEVELKRNQVPYEREKRFDVLYEGVLLRHKFKADFFVYNSIILEIKATSRFHSDNFKQTLNYLKSGHVKLGILINFGTDRVEFRRIVCST